MTHRDEWTCDCCGAVWFTSSHDERGPNYHYHILMLCEDCEAVTQQAYARITHDLATVIREIRGLPAAVPA